MYWLLDLVESIIQYFQMRTAKMDGKLYKSKEEEIEDGFKHLSKDVIVFFGVVVFVLICVGIYAIFLS